MRVVPVLRAGAKFQPVYVADVAQAVVKALGDETAAGKTFELGGPDVLSMGAAGSLDRRRDRPGAVDRRDPDFVGGLIAMGGFLPGAPITRDQWQMLQKDNVVSGGAEGLGALGLSPTPMDAVAPGWLVQYRRHGRFGTRAAA